MLDTMPTKKDAPEPVPPVVRIPEETRERIARVRDAMSKRAALSELPPAVVVREALDRGLDSLESELGIGKGKR
jgi:hypothetical protein